MTHMKQPYQQPTIRLVAIHSTILAGSGSIISKKPLILEENKAVDIKAWQIDFNSQKCYVPEGNASEGRAKATDTWDNEE